MMFNAASAWLALVAVIAPQIAKAQGPWRVSDRPLVTLGSVSGTGADMFGRVVGAIRLSSGAVMIADGIRLDVRLFAADGKLLRKAGGQGDGPGEFRTIKSMRRCAGDSVFVYDPGLFRISVFGPDGAFVRTLDVRQAASTAVQPYEFFCNNAGVTAYLHRSPAPPTGIGPRRPNVVITVAQRDQAGKPLGTFPASERYFDGSNDFPRPLGKETFIAIGSDAIYVGTGDSFEVSVFSTRGERLRTVRDTATQRRVTPIHVAKFVDQYVARSSGRTDKRVLHKLYSELRYPESFPAYGKILVDPSGRLWVEEYPIPGTDTRAWRAYSREGQAIGTVEMPKSFELMEVGSDYVLGVWRDELDVEFVQLHTLLRAGARAR